MKQLLQICAFVIMCTGTYSQSVMLRLPNGTSGISTTTSGSGVAIGPGFTDPESRLHILDKTDDGTALILELKDDQIDDQQGGLTPTSPDYFLQAKYGELSGAAQTKFSINASGRVQSGFFNASVSEQLAVLNNMAIYRGTDQKIRLELSNNEPRFRWKSPGKNFQFVNDDNASIALQLSENGDVGVNTENFTSTHKLHVEGGTLSDKVYVQPAADWNSTDDYVGLEFTDRPEIRWKSGSADYFEFKADDTGKVPLRLSSAGKVGINTDNFGESNHSLYIAGSSVAEEMFVKLSDNWGDFVFEKEYDLMPLDELENYLEENKHLPDFPSAAEVEKDGLALGETERLLTIKVEELTLYILELKKEIDTLRDEIKD